MNSTAAWEINDNTLPPYSLPLKSRDFDGKKHWSQEAAQEGLLVKTYQNDLYNNWMRSTWVEGHDGINELSSVLVVGGEFSINQLNLKEKVFIMLNNIANAGGTWDN